MPPKTISTGTDEDRKPDLHFATMLARIHATAFAGEGRPWSGTEILALLREPVVSVRLAYREGAEPVGFALYRVVVDEAELLTVSVMPEAWRRGLGAGLLAACHQGARLSGAARMFLEVAEGNKPARSLYDSSGYRECGRRKGYYRHPDGSHDDAVVMEKPL
jgi:ribosomal-protein-alanine N-acetyltransferase